ncbi:MULTISPECIES: flagellar motor protein MotB [Halomonadaceae]|uniref:flagellar motor protein MotB n=1 Tax=Halomonadaceae TaxID=28256 RepID=UPI0015991E0F|nr:MULTISPECIES: flagellar motor protein MotB [Halomonas]QJQ96563.1 flagellar motor protein MotB [Halomonas sp. PA5]
MSDDRRPIIIKRKKVVHGHHGGSWKIALADFMTALMALFLVLWILSTASEEQLESVAEYFRTPLAVAIAGGDRPTASDSAIPGGGPDPVYMEGERMRIDMRTQTRSSDEQRNFRDLQRRMEALIEADPMLRDLRRQIRFDMTPEGLRIQLVDTEQRPMFEIGSEQVASYMRVLLRTIAPLLNEMPNPLSISGHTDSLPYAGGYRGYSNWELSTDRANASRRELVAGGLDPEKLLRVAGLGDRVPMADSDPRDAHNRRISLVVLDRRAAESIQSQGLPGGSSLPSPEQSRLADELESSPVEQFREGLQDTLSGD